VKDFIRCALRGGIGSAIGGATSTLLLCLCSFGPSWELLYLFHPLILTAFAIPGLIVGFVMWLVLRLTGIRLVAIWRIALGAGVMLTTYLLFVLYASGGRIEPGQFSILAIVLMLLWLTLTGGFSGLLSPSEILVSRKMPLTYWDRVALYEIAATEASIARQCQTSRMSGL
jgi:hypothetical protein